MIANEKTAHVSVVGILLDSQLLRSEKNEKKEAKKAEMASNRHGSLTIGCN